MKVRLLGLAVLCALLFGWSTAEQSSVELKARIPEGLDIFVNYAAKDVLEKSSQRVKLAKSRTVDYETDREALMSGEIDFVISPRPFADGPGGDGLLHFPVATGGFVLVANVVPNAQTRMNAEQLAGIFNGQIPKWNTPSLLTENPAFSTVDVPIKIVTWDPEGYATLELKRYLEFNSEGVWTSSPSFSSNTQPKDTFEEALAYVKQNPGSITYVPFKHSGDLFPFSIFIPQSADFVSPVLNHFVNALMPLKKPSDLPKADETSKWKDFSLTDMRKMPPDGSCMSMPPYPLSHFFYLVMKRDQSVRAELRGAALAAFVRVMVSPDIQSTATSTGVVTYTPAAAQRANVESLKTIKFRGGESLETFLNNVPIKEASPDSNNMPNMGPGQGDMEMEPASSAAVYAMIVCLLLSGIICVVGYIITLKCYRGGTYADHATWLPWQLKKRSETYAALEKVEPLSKV
jgi:ABC-type phosphate transport system substrate-binding protein